MSYTATCHVSANTDIRVLPCTQLLDGRAVIFVVIEGLTIVAHRWEDLQRLVLALHDGIADARQGEDEAAKAIFAGSGMDWPAATPTTATTETASVWNLQAGADSDKPPSAAEVAAAEEELIEAGGHRVRLQRQARAQLLAEGGPLCRATVAVRACALLHAERKPVDDLQQSATVDQAVASQAAAMHAYLRSGLAKVAARLRAGRARRVVLIGRSGT
jgi:hypothetical protein